VPPELAEFERRAIRAGLAAATAASQMRSVRSMVKAASRQRGRSIGVRELLLDPHLLATAACDAARLDGRGDQELTDATLQARRIAARSFMRLMEDLLGSDADPLIADFEAALRARWELVGMTYLSTSGRPTGHKTFTPTQSDVEALLRELASSPNAYFAERNVAFICLVASTGLRLSSAVGVDGADFYRLGSTLWVTVREKCKREPSQVPVPPEVEAALCCYISAFNRYATDRGLSVRIGVSVPGPFWRSPPTHCWTAPAAQQMTQRTTGRACSRPFGPHTIRRFVAQRLVHYMSRTAVAEALRWDSVATLDEHYGPPPPDPILPEAPARPSSEVGKECQHARTRTQAP
jgi:integrase